MTGITTLGVLVLFAGAAIVGFLHLTEKLNMVVASLAELEREIQNTASVSAAAIVFIKDAIERLEELAKHPDAAKIRELAAQLRSHTDELAHAIADHEE